MLSGRSLVERRWPRKMTNMDGSAHKQQLVDAMKFLTDALAYVPNPMGDVVFISDDLRVQIAWHLARAGAGPVPGQAIIKRRALPDRPGQFAGAIEWVHMDAPDFDIEQTESLSAYGELDVDAMNRSLPWHVKTKIQGDFR